MSKKILIGVAVLAAILVASYLFVQRYLESPDLSDELKDRLITLVKEKSNGLYTLGIGAIHIDAGKQSATLTDITLVADSSRKIPTTYELKLDNLLIKNVDVVKLLSSQSVELSSISVSGGELVVRRHFSKSKEEKEEAPETVSESKSKILKSVRTSLTGIQIDTLQMNDVDLSYYNLKKQKQSVKKIHIDLYDLAIDSTGLNDSSRIFFARSMRLAIDSLSMPIGGNSYSLTASKFLFTINEKSITNIKQLRLRPTSAATLEAAAAKTKVQQDVFGMTIRDITADNIDFQALLEDSTLKATSLVLSDAVLQVFNDKSNPPATESKVGKYPHQLLDKIPYKTDIPIIAIENGSVTYMEKNEKADAIGKISFSKVNGKLGPILNYSNKRAPVSAEFTALFMDQSPVFVTFKFPVSNNGAFSVKADFSAFPVSVLNAATLPLGNTKLKEGKVNKLSFLVNGNNNNATGTSTMTYEGLKIEVMKQDKEDGYKKNGLLSMIANEFFLHENNRPGDRFPDQSTATYQRVPTKSFFNLVWKTVFYTVKGNTGVGLKGKDKDRATIR